RLNSTAATPLLRSRGAPKVLASLRIAAGAGGPPGLTRPRLPGGTGPAPSDTRPRLTGCAMTANIVHPDCGRPNRAMVSSVTMGSSAWQMNSSGVSESDTVQYAVNSDNVLRGGSGTRSCHTQWKATWSWKLRPTPGRC